MSHGQVSAQRLGSGSEVDSHSPSVVACTMMAHERNCWRCHSGLARSYKFHRHYAKTIPEICRSGMGTVEEKLLEKGKKAATFVV